VAAGRDFLFQNRQEASVHLRQFYAAPAMYMISGDTWESYYNQIKPMLLGATRQRG
jgi:hypothetical protein